MYFTFHYGLETLEWLWLSPQHLFETSEEKWELFNRSELYRTTKDQIIVLGLDSVIWWNSRLESSQRIWSSGEHGKRKLAGRFCQWPENDMNICARKKKWNFSIRSDSLGCPRYQILCLYPKHNIWLPSWIRSCLMWLKSHKMVLGSPSRKKHNWINSWAPCARQCV